MGADGLSCCILALLASQVVKRIKVVTEEHGLCQGRSRIFVLGVRSDVLTRSVGEIDICKLEPTLPLRMFLNMDLKNLVDEKKQNATFTKNLEKARIKHGRL